LNQDLSWIHLELQYGSNLWRITTSFLIIYVMISCEGCIEMVNFF
jgi:hypothetical protein